MYGPAPADMPSTGPGPSPQRWGPRGPARCGCRRPRRPVTPGVQPRVGFIAAMVAAQLTATSRRRHSASVGSPHFGVHNRIPSSNSPHPRPIRTRLGDLCSSMRKVNITVDKPFIGSRRRMTGPSQTDHLAQQAYRQGTRQPAGANPSPPGTRAFCPNG